VVEVLSPSTSTVDTGQKLAGYFRVPPVQHYWTADPRKRVVIAHRRVEDMIQTAIVRSGPIVLAPPGITIPVEELYDR